MLIGPAERGFTLVELLVGITLVAMLLGLGAPAMGTYLQNSKLAAATGNFLSGLQTARSEAIRRNVNAQFVLTDSAVSASNVANTLAVAATGRNWVVRAPRSAASAALFDAVDAKPVMEGDSGTAPAVQIAASAASPAVFDGTVTFNGFGQTLGNVAYSFDISNPVAGTCVAGGGKIRCRRINVSPGGQITACDPAASTGDSRACPP